MEESPASFRSTHVSSWTLVERVYSPDPLIADAALEEFYRFYERAIINFIRHRVSDREDARDISQEFFHNKVIVGKKLAQADRARGRLRDFMRLLIENEISDFYRRQAAAKRGGKNALVSLEAVQADQPNFGEAVDDASPDRVWDREWAITLLKNLQKEVLAENGWGGDPKILGVLGPELVPDTGRRTPETIARVAAVMGLSKENAVVALSRLGVKFKEKLVAAIREQETDQSDSNVRNQLQYFCDLLKSPVPFFAKTPRPKQGGRKSNVDSQ